MGIDPGEYARLLMSNAKESAKIIPPSQTAPVGILREAYWKTNVQVHLSLSVKLCHGMG